MRFMNLVADGGLSWRSFCLFDPATLTVASLASTAAGGLASAGSTLAGGDYAERAGQLQAAQLRQNASQAMASGQRQMFDTQLKTRLAASTARANAAGSGVAADSGSPLEDQGQLARRGEYQSLMQMFNGESEATGLRNQADAAEFEGETKKNLSRAQAFGTLAGTAGSMFQMYGAYRFPTIYGRAGVGGLPGRL